VQTSHTYKLYSACTQYSYRVVILTMMWVLVQRIDQLAYKEFNYVH